MDKSRAVKHRHRVDARDERGQGLVEYALIIALVSLASIAALGFLSGKINTLFSKAGNSLNGVSIAAGGSGGGGPLPGAPLPGSVSLSPSGPLVLNVNFTATNSGWNDNGSPITTFNYTWRRTADGVNCGGAYGAPINTDTSTSPDATDDLPLLSANQDRNRCYRVEVTATNGNGTSAAVVSNQVAIHQNPADSDITATVSPSSNVFDGQVLSASVTSNNIIVETYDYWWQRKTTAEGDNGNCGSAASWDALSSEDNSTSSVSSITTTGSTTAGSGTPQDYCYRLVVEAENEAGDGTATSNAVYVEGNG